MCPACLVGGPGAEEGGGVAEGADPVEGCGGGGGVGVAGPFVVAKRAERFDVLVVLPPAARDDVVVEMREPLAELVDPDSQVVPFVFGLVGGDRRPVSGAGDVVDVGFGVVVVAEDGA